MSEASSGQTAALAVDEDFRDIACPFCNGKHTSLLSLFGGNAGEVLMRCADCGTVFHWVKWQGKLPPHP